MPQCENCRDRVNRRHRTKCCGALLCGDCHTSHEVDRQFDGEQAAHAGGATLELVINDFTREIGLRLGGGIVVGMSAPQAVQLGRALIMAGIEQGQERAGDEGKAGRDA